MSTKKYVDMLDEDKPIANQKFACISFVSPEKILKSKEIFCFQQFLKQFQLSKNMDVFMSFLNFVAFKYKLKFNDLHEDFKEFVQEEKDKLQTEGVIENAYKTYLDQNEDDLEKEFNVEHEFTTSVRGLKIRGVYASKEEAELRCKILREMDPNHDVYVGPVGLWLPWHPEPYKTENVQYMEDELNQLMFHKKVNEDNAKSEFEKRVKETKQKAIEENVENAKRFGTRLTQTINDQGQLVSLTNANTQEEALKTKGSALSICDVHDELFEGDNIVIPSKNKG